MTDNINKISDDQLATVTGGECDADKYKNDLGTVSQDPFTGEITYVDKTQAIGKFTKAQWDTLKQNWAYTGDPDLYIRTVNVAELNKML
ncbi:MAG: hypothetical protein K6E63_01955 [Lachnospiraceae bacterium]|nr:hypothetical protein [Lachnospiraceae bacterium]